MKRKAPLLEYFAEIPPFVLSGGLSYLDVQLSDEWADGPQAVRISIRTLTDDVYRYGSVWCVAGVWGDWRYLSDLCALVADYILFAQPRMTKRQRAVLEAFASVI